MENGEWRNGLFSHVCGGDCATCMGAWCCSCFLYGRVDERLDQFPDETKPGLCNGGCWLMCGAGCLHLHWLVTLFKRGDVRNKYGIKGDGCTDCLASYFCFPCALAQMDTEIKDRAKLLNQGGGGLKEGGYSQPQGGMVYQQPTQPMQTHQQSYQGGYPEQPNDIGYQQTGYVNNQNPPKY